MHQRISVRSCLGAAVLSLASSILCVGIGYAQPAEQPADSRPLERASTPSICSLLDPRIINGKPCSATSSPVVMYQIVSSAGTGFCSGTMISADYLLTAAHCLMDRPTSVTVLAGKKKIAADRYAIHPKFRQLSLTTLGYDAALIHLSKKTTLPVIPLAVSPALGAGGVISIFGYGLDQNGTAGHLLAGTMRLSAVSSYLLTARYLGTGSNTCQGDSGGPALYSFQDKAGMPRTGIVGLTSTGSVPSCGPGDTSSFTNVRTKAIVDFIRKYVPSVGRL